MTLAGRIRATACTLALITLAACGGGGDDGGTAPPPPATGIGAAGGTVASGDAKVVIPAGALTTNVDVAVAKTSAGAPALPSGVTSVGDTFAFTPHGTTFAKPVTITIPFDASKVPAGSTLVVYKTNAANTGWDVMHGATLSGNTISVNVTGFSTTFAALQPPEGFPDLTEKQWTFVKDDYLGPGETPFDTGTQTGGRLDRAHSVGADYAVPPAGQEDPKAHLEVFSNESGKSFFTQAQSPRTLPGDAERLNAARTKLVQTYTFMVQDPKATLDFVITHAVVEIFDGGGNPPSHFACPQAYPSATEEQFIDKCGANMNWAENFMEVSARKVGAATPFFEKQGSMIAFGAAGHQDFSTNVAEDVDLFANAGFVTETSDARYIKVTLGGEGDVHFPTHIPLSTLQPGDLINVTVDMYSYARNLTQGESFSSAMLRDPVSFDDGPTLQFTGLEQLPVNHDAVPAAVAVACAIPDAEAGQFEFSEASYEAPEAPEGVEVVVRRTGGKHGEVLFLLESTDGSAQAGADFEAQHRIIRFGDGEGGSKIVTIPFTQDKTEELNESFTLKLTQFAGCATPGAHATTTVDILDDDRFIAPPSTFHVSGTISGLAGSGLVLVNQLRGIPLPASGTTFTFPEELSDGSIYRIAVQTQPANPLQACTVANGDGTIHGANATNVAVTCVTPPSPGSLDVEFGDHGRVATNVGFASALLGGRVGLALQADGKILLVGGLKLLRLNADGTMDTTFGSAGVVPVVFNGQTLDTAMDVAVQASGKIVVAGTTSATAVGSDDFALTRFNADGTLDTTFGTAGHVTTDFFGSTDQVRRMKLQPDGRIVVIGRAAHILSPTSGTFEFAIVRYSVDGATEPGFGGGGKSTNTPGGVITEPLGLAIDSVGKIVTCGRSAIDGGTEPDSGFVKYLANGVADTGFGTGGNGALLTALGNDDSCVDVVTAENDDIVGAISLDVSPGIGGLNHGFGLVRMNANGIPAPGAPQIIATLTTQSDRPSAMLRQADGKFVLVGQSGALSTNPDIAVVRFREDGLALDPSFGTDGKFTLDFFGGTDVATAVAQQPDGKLVVAGVVRNGSIRMFGVTRLSP